MSGADGPVVAEARRLSEHYRSGWRNSATRDVAAVLDGVLAELDGARREAERLREELRAASVLRATRGSAVSGGAMTLTEALAVLDAAAVRFDAGLFLDRAVAVVKARLAEQDELRAYVLELCDVYDDELSDDGDGGTELLIGDIRGALGADRGGPAMSSPFSNSTSGELFITNRCDRCAHSFGIDDPCDDFLPAYVGVWPTILARVPITDRNPVGVECTRFEVTW